MRKISAGNIQKAVEELCIKANTSLRPDILACLKKTSRMEKNKKAKDVLKALLENAKIAKGEKIAICQDTGMVVIYLEIGQEVKISGGGLERAVNKGVKDAYRSGYFRKSVVGDPFIRINTKNNSPCIIYTKITKGTKVKITVSIRGFGSENKCTLKMFNPTATISEIKKYIIETIKDIGPDACPPFVVGIGIGGTFDKVASLAKEAVLGSLEKKNPLQHLRRLEKELLNDINKLKIGPMGLGGRTTALGVKILSHPTHIAGMPVAVNISCHATRSATKTL